MTWEQFASFARDWMRRLPPAEARAALAALMAAAVANHREVDLDAAIALALKAKPAPVPKAKAEPQLPAAPPLRDSKKAKRPAGEKLGTDQGLRGRLRHAKNGLAAKFTIFIFTRRLASSHP